LALGDSRRSTLRAPLAGGAFQERVKRKGSNLMAVREVIFFEVKPGRFDEFVRLARELKSMLERIDVGLRDIRLSQALIAGTTSGRVSLVAEYDSLSSWAASIEKENNDPALVRMVKEASGPDASFTMVNRVLVTDIDL
jgi:hypothetical protein